MASERLPIDANEKRKVEGLRAKRPHELQQTESYVWHKKDVLGKGSFGKVCRGWDRSTYGVVAVKIVRREHYERDAKVKENLMREIKIQKELGDCENVVRLLEIERASEGRILIMELCDSDLQQYVKKVQGLDEEATKDFLKQIASGLERMHDAGLVHRDLKPGNILLKKDPVTNRIIYKLADFGFARSFVSDQEKTLQMQSLAGTPVFMAPEALECVFYHGKSYDAKVDLWSVGALLYNVLVGKPGFYATLQLILDILKRKGNAIAFDRNAPGGTRYICELPAEIDSRLSRGFKEKMNVLLRRLLMLDPKQRMTFQEFFDFVRSLTATEIVLFHVGPGYRYEISQDPDESCKSLFGRLADRAKVPRDRLLAITEQGSEKLIESENVPQFLKIGNETHRIFVFNEESLDSSIVPQYISLAVKKLNDRLLDATERNRLLLNSKLLFDHCEVLIKDAKEWTSSQMKGLHCYQALLETCSKDMGRVCEEALEIGEKFKFQFACVKESMEADRDCLAQLKASEKVTASLEDGFTSMDSKGKQFLSEVEEIAEKCRNTIKSVGETKNERFGYDYQTQLEVLVRMRDEVKRLKGEESLHRSEELIRSTRDYHMYFIEELHNKMRVAYFPLREGRFLFEELYRLRTERMSRAVKELRDIQKKFKQSIFQAMMARSDDVGASKSAALQAELQKKSEELEKETETRQLYQKKLMDVMNEKADRDANENGDEDEPPNDEPQNEEYSIIPSPNSLAMEETVYETAKVDLAQIQPSLGDDSPDGPEATIRPNPENGAEATIRPNPQLSLADGVKVAVSDVQKACKGLQLAANFYHNLAKMTGVLDSVRSAEKESAASGDGVFSKRSASAFSFLSVFPADVFPSDDLKSRAAEVEGFDYMKIQDAVRNKVSLSNFHMGDLVLFWPTSSPLVFRAMTTTSVIYFLNKKCVKDYNPERLNGRAILATVKRPPIAKTAKDGDAYKINLGESYYVVQADVKQFL